MTATRKKLLACSFCGKPKTQVLKLIAGPGVYICDECTCLCVEIIGEEMAEEEGAEGAVARRLHDELEELRRLVLARRGR